MAKIIKLSTGSLRKLRDIDPRLISYNVEMTEITGGTFWRPFTPEQVAGTAEFRGGGSMPEEDSGQTDLLQDQNLMQYYSPADLKNPRLRKLTKALGPAWVRVSGSWATKTYYDFDGHTNGKVPEGYQNILTKEQWLGVLDFVRDLGLKLLISVANCEGLHKAHDPWEPSQARLIFDLSRDYGVPIDAVEFMNEPNALVMSGAPVGYTPADYARDQDIFIRWVRENYPDTIIVGPCSAGDAPMKPDLPNGGMGENMPIAPTDELMVGTVEPLDVYSYHFYTGGSERLVSFMKDVHWPASEALTEVYLDRALNAARLFAPMRDKYCPGGQMWVTETADAGGGGNTWSSTYLDVPRFLNELGGFSAITDGVLFHNTLASSDYGFLQHGSFTPRPNYFAALLWYQLMGTVVYDAGPVSEGAHVYVHSRKDGKPGSVWLIINNSADVTVVELPQSAQQYTLAGEGGNLRSTVMTLNGARLVLREGDKLPEFIPVERPSGTVELAPGTCTFFVF